MADRTIKMIIIDGEDAIIRLDNDDVLRGVTNVVFPRKNTGEGVEVELTVRMK